ncbi:signal transducer and activator of transcription B isoform X5 [Uranotaenia lowii]|uniref:signal transducer and activator of transcription B isoform X5 n=1 Tax=Uranotaenia lowii TaxID=190385 RepID=UPI002479845B|nr:signal transducer and activator of transcription B isoform X5 [Uranotaenia lowii]
MTTATVAVQQSEKLRRFPATQQGSNVAATLIAAYRMNETQQMHTTDTSQQQHQHQSNAAGSNLSIHNNNNNNNNNGSGKNRSSNSGGLGDAKMDHHLQLFRERERERELHHREQRRGGGDRDLESSSSSSVNQQGNQQHQSQSQQQQSAIHPRSSIASPTPSEQQQYALKWNDFQSSILSSFRHLRDEEDFVDVTIACEQRSFTAHKVVLSACSPYFRKLLKANPCEHPIVILRDVRSEDIESLLRFMYNGEVHIGQDQLSDFLKTAQLLQVRGLADVTNPGPGRTTSNNSSMLNSSSLSTPAVQELKASPTSTSLPWEPPEDNRGNAPPPQKRTKSSELYRKQHGLSPDDPIPIEHMPVGQHPLTRDRDRSKDKQSSKDSLRDFEHRDRDHRDRSLELRDSLLGQALEGGPTLSVPSSVGANNHISITPGKLTNNSSQDNLEMRFPNVFSQQKHPDLLSLQNVANGDDSNSSDTGASDHGDDIESMNENVEHTRPSFPFLGLQGIPGLIPGPSGMHGDNFDARQHCDTRIKEEMNDDDDRDEDNNARHRQRRLHEQQRQSLQQQHQQQERHQKQQQEQQQRSCLISASLDGLSGRRSGPTEPDESDSRYEDEDDDEDDEGMMEEPDMKDGILSGATTLDSSDYHKQLAAAGVLAAAAAAANGASLGDGSDQNDFFVAHKSGSRDLAFKQHILNEKARLQAHLQRHQQQLAGFLLSTTAAAATTPPSSTPQNCSTSSSVSPFTAGSVNTSSVNNSFSHDSKSQKLSQHQNDRTSNLFAYSSSGSGNSNNPGGQVYLLPCPLCEVPLEPRVFRQHLDRHYPRDSPVCPVIQCGRRFAHPNSVRNHMRLKHTSQWAKMKAMRSSGGPFTGIP